VGDILQVVESEKIARKKAEEVASIVHEDALAHRKKFSLATLKAKIAAGKMDQLKVIIKADSNGTLEAVTSEVNKVKTEASFAKVVHSGVGEITESDIMLASAGETILVGFNVKTPGRVQKIADQEGLEVLNFDVIYHLTEKIFEILEGKEEAKETEEILGQFKIKAVFAANKKMSVVGGDVLEGRVRKLAKFRLLREQVNEETKEKEEVVIGQAKIETVQQGQKEVNEMNEGTECGLRLQHEGLVFEKGDRLELFVAKK
jgi:translation initiation factor IF-2